MTGFFTGEVEDKYPHPTLDIRILLVVEDAIRYAWKILRKYSPDRLSLSAASEKEITIVLLNVLEKLRGKNIVNGFDSKTFETVIREGNLANYNGKHPDKEPDFVFRLHKIRVGTESVQDGIIAECKPIDIKHPVGSIYCEKGIRRFVDGDYAWAMHSGMMVGYVSGNYTVYPKLSDPLKKDKKGIYNTQKMPYICPQSKRLKKEPTVYITIHKRKWEYPQTGDKAPDIKIRHIWLQK